MQPNQISDSVEINLEEQVIYPEALAGKEEMFRCKICYQLLFLHNEPSQCSKCQNVLFHKNCITIWIRQKGTCAFCRQQTSIQPCQRLILDAIMDLQFKCKNEEIGCTFIGTYENLMEHQRICDSLKCQLCGESIIYIKRLKKERYGVNFFHICGKNSLVEIKPEERQKYFFVPERIAPNQSYNLILGAKCYLCMNLIRDPLCCDKCQKNFCKICIANHFLNYPINARACPSCGDISCSFIKLPRNTLEILAGIQIYCCKKQNHERAIFSYDQILAHEAECRPQLCQVGPDDRKNFNRADLSSFTLDSESDRNLMQQSSNQEQSKMEPQYECAGYRVEDVMFFLYLMFFIIRVASIALGFYLIFNMNQGKFASAFIMILVGSILIQVFQQCIVFYLCPCFNLEKNLKKCCGCIIDVLLQCSEFHDLCKMDSTECNLQKFTKGVLFLWGCFYLLGTILNLGVLLLFHLIEWESECYNKIMGLGFLALVGGIFNFLMMLSFFVGLFV